MGFTTTGANHSLNAENNAVKGSFALIGAVFVKDKPAIRAGSGPEGNGLQVDAYQL